MAKLLGKADILQAKDVLTQDVEVPEWGGTVRLRGLSGIERDQYEQSCVTGRGKNRDVNLSNARAKLVARCAIGEDGATVFSDEDVAELGKKSAKALDRLFQIAQKLSGLSDDDVKELTEGLKTAQSAASTSA